MGNWPLIFSKPSSNHCIISKQNTLSLYEVISAMRKLPTMKQAMSYLHFVSFPDNWCYICSVFGQLDQEQRTTRYGLAASPSLHITYTEMTVKYCVSFAFFDFVVLHCCMNKTSCIYFRQCLHYDVEK
jgi:hypothetical protein